ncbi:MAG: septal ring lytic transglycosylase RlpA family protein [Thermoleophilia bacterium]
MRRRILSAALLATIAATGAAGAPSLNTLRQDVARTARADAAAEQARSAHQAALVATRAELDAARTRMDARVEALTLRLRELYAKPETTPLLALTTLDPDAARAQAEFADVVARSDAALVAEARSAYIALQASEARLEQRRRALMVAARVAAARHARASARLTAARTPAPSPIDGETAVGVTRGLPTELIRAQSLPGESPIDAETGQPLRFGRAGSAQQEGALPRRFSLTTGWYSPTMRRTASGELFDPGALTAAHRTLPFGTRLRLWRGSSEVVVRVNDRGPFVPGRDLDLSPAAARALGMHSVSVLRAEVVSG